MDSNSRAKYNIGDQLATEFDGVSLSGTYAVNIVGDGYYVDWCTDRVYLCQLHNPPEPRFAERYFTIQESHLHHLDYNEEGQASKL